MTSRSEGRPDTFQGGVGRFPVFVCPGGVDSAFELAHHKGFVWFKSDFSISESDCIGIKQADIHIFPDCGNVHIESKQPLFPCGGLPAEGFHPTLNVKVVVCLIVPRKFAGDVFCPLVGDVLYSHTR